jgi:ArsR family transcriptional regulator
MEYGFGEYILIFKALSDETRLRIIMMLTKGRTCACKILDKFHFTQPTLSYHMKQLTDVGAATAESRQRKVAGGNLFYNLILVEYCGII